ncbi:MAG TPA: acyl-CoA dehydrogenase [Polyangiales bacterium]|nr:acyl-CoA dehydrogenase [Polyangiales bacterium]
MRFAHTDEQLLSRDALRELLRDHCNAGQLRKLFESDRSAQIEGLWAKLVQLGVIGALAPESAGGLGLDAVDLCVLLEETGRAAVPELVVETAAMAVPLLAALPDDPRAAECLARVLAGQADVAVGLGPSVYLAGAADRAGAILCERAGEIHLLEPDRVRITRQRSVDRARLLSRVEFEPRAETCLARGELAQQLSAAALDRAALGTAAQLVGLGARMLELTLSHVQTREQFGRPIGSFQAVKHQLVDAHVALEYARPLVYRAAYSLARQDPGAAVHVSMAKASASDAALLTARKALQLHGAIGYSYEYDLQLFMKRTWALAAAYGDALEHRKRIADLVLVAEGETHA